MPIYRTERFLEKAIESILDQDYKDWELICVSDGYSRKASLIIKTFNDPRIKHINISHGGACKARNEGAKVAAGKYISFFSSDFRAIPGMLRKWVDTFQEHPEADFIYGGYMFPNRQIYPSEEFDPRQLEVYNYIDGGFPLKKEIWEKYPWDEKIKSLNDWDFWLRIVKVGYRGYYLGNYYSYIAEPPRTGGLSHDSSQNWIERVKQIRENNNIPQRSIVVASLGAPFFGKNLAKFLDADFMPMPSFKPHTYKMVYLLGFYPNSADKHARVFLNCQKDCKKVIHWLGSDIAGLKKLSWESLNALGNTLNQTMSIMFAESKVQQRELIKMGIKTEVLPLLRDISSFTRKPMPKDFAVAVYLPGVNTDNYHPILIENITKNMPDVQFYLYGDRGVKEQQDFKNVHIVGWKDINEIIDKTSILLRYTVHDGLPTAPMEFLMSGRYVVSNVDMPYIEKIDSKKDEEGVRKIIIEKIRQIKKKIRKKQYPTDEAVQYYKDYLNPNKIKKRLHSIINGVYRNKSI